tara:strand:+ start:414 stop:698 length:285 start_codon:yes stop_codon:yes gene_type:complete
MRVRPVALWLVAIVCPPLRLLIEQEYEALAYNVALVCTGWVLLLGLPNEVVLKIAGYCAIALSILQAIAQCHVQTAGLHCFEEQAAESKLDKSP